MEEVERKMKAALRNAIYLQMNGLPRSIWLTCGMDEKYKDAIWLKAQKIASGKPYTAVGQTADFI